MGENYSSLDYGAAKARRAPTALQQSEHRFRLFVDAVQDYGIVMLDLDGRIATWNTGAERIHGYKSHEILGQHISTLYSEEERRAGTPERDLKSALREGRFDHETWRVRKDGSRLWANVTLTALKDDDDRLYGFGEVTRDISMRRKAEEVLRQNEERFRLLVEEVRDYAIFMLDPEGHISSWNRGAEQFKGYREKEIIGKHFSVFYPEADRRAGKPERELEIASREGRVEDEGWRVRKDGSMFWANVVITALRDHTGKLIGFGKVTRDITDRMRSYAELQTANLRLASEVSEKLKVQKQLQESEESLRMLSRHLLRTQDEERRRIGRDLHDSVGQYLAVLKMGLDSLQHLIQPDNEAAQQALAQCTDLVGDSIKEVRTISYLLYPPMLEETGLRSAIQWYLEGFAKRSSIETSFDIPADFGRLPRDLELAFFRVLQESLTNVHRHSGSPTAAVRLAANNGMISLEVKDHGKGIPARILNESRKDSSEALGVGLRGMNERMRQLGGKLDVFSTPEGTTIIATAPANPS